MPTPAGYLARGSIRRGGAEGAYFWLPCWCSRVACFQLSAPAWHGGVEAGRSAPWPPGELGRPWRSSVAQGELSRPRQSDIRGSSVAPGGARSPPGELGRTVLCGFLPRGGLQRLSYINIPFLAFCSFTAPVSLFSRFCAQQTLLSLRHEAHKEEEEDATWTEKDL